MVPADEEYMPMKTWPWKAAVVAVAIAAGLWFTHQQYGHASQTGFGKGGVQTRTFIEAFRISELKFDSLVLLTPEFDAMLAGAEVRISSAALRTRILIANQSRLLMPVEAEHQCAKFSGRDNLDCVKVYKQLAKLYSRSVDDAKLSRETFSKEDFEEAQRLAASSKAALLEADQIFSRLYPNVGRP